MAEPWQDLSTVHSEQQQKPLTIASAATIAPQTFLSIITGTTQIATITPRVPNAMQLIALVFDTTNTGVFLTTGNIAVTTTTVTHNTPVLLLYNPVAAKWYYLLSK